MLRPIGLALRGRGLSRAERRRWMRWKGSTSSRSWSKPAAIRRRPQRFWALKDERFITRRDGSELIFEVFEANMAAQWWWSAKRKRARSVSAIARNLN